MSPDPLDEPDEAPASKRAGETTHTIDSPETDAHRVERFWLTVITGPDTGKVFTSESERAVLGTHASADLVLTDDTVSRFHCEIELGAEHPLVRDLGSRNGTFVNGVSVVGAHLREGASIRLGKTELRFDIRQGDSLDLPLYPGTRFGRMVGKSRAMRRDFTLLERAAATDSAVLIEGETGTGKELAAESIHEASTRKGGPFIVVDCGAIPGDLLESELFGHERGAFTGASVAREGAFEAAAGGTIFLDEIGELSIELQPKLLRALERKHVKRVGANTYAPVDVRIIAATNRSLRREVNERRFRSDLYFRLAVIEVRLPPLRERPEDIPLIVEQLIDALGVGGHPDAQLLCDPSFLAEVSRHNWAGNVRELRNHLERCLVLKSRAPLTEPEPSSVLPDFDQPLRAARERWSRTLERRYVEELLSRHEGNVSAAARAAGVDRMYFYRLLWRHGLK